MTVKIAVSNIVSAFNTSGVVGSKVVDHERFLDVLEQAVSKHDFSSDRIPGQGFVELGTSVNRFVSSGVGKAAGHGVNDFVLAEHRGRVSAYLKRDFAAPVTSCACVVYTLEAYVRDPDVRPEEAQGFKDSGATHVLVAVLASSGEQSSTLSPYRFAHNLAGGNREAQVWSADEIRSKAREIMNYSNEWSMVAD